MPALSPRRADAAAAIMPRAWPESVTREWAIGDSTGEGVSVCIVDSGGRWAPARRALASAVGVERHGEERSVELDETGDVVGHAPRAPVSSVRSRPGASCTACGFSARARRAAAT